ncbi:MAG TPA: DMT family transporter [Acetobacteraceae bacterium]|jgi:drug/metabolite transporter (DMT)-like permease
MLDRLAPFGFVLLWSSSFIASRVGLRHLSPLLFVSVRMWVCAAVLVSAMLVLRRPWRVLRGKWLHCAVAGVLVNAILLMTAHVAMTRVPAAPIALVQTLNPLLTAALAWPVLGERLTPRQWLGLLLGAAGVVLIVGLAALHSTVEARLLLLTVGGVFALVGGTLYFGRFCRGVPMLEGTTVQFLASAVVCTLSLAVFETPHADWTWSAIESVAWNAGAVSLGGMVLYLLMLARGTVARATANFYLVPGFAAVLAWWLLGERLAPLTVVGLVVSSVGCWLVSQKPRPRSGVGPRSGSTRGA